VYLLPDLLATLRISSQYPAGTAFSGRYSIWWKWADLRNDNNLKPTSSNTECIGALCSHFYLKRFRKPLA